MRTGEKFLQVIGIHGDPVATRRRIDAARRRGERFEGPAYSYRRAFGHVPGRDDERWVQTEIGTRALATIAVLDPTAGGGSIPFEVLRLAARAVANDLNSVSTLIMRATAEWPSVRGAALISAFDELSGRFVRAREERLEPYFPPERESSAISTNYLWARTVRFPYCDGVVPLSPNWGPRRTGRVSGSCRTAPTVRELRAASVRSRSSGRRRSGFGVRWPVVTGTVRIRTAVG